MLTWFAQNGLITVAFLGIGAYLLHQFKAMTEAAGKTFAEETAKTFIQQREWSATLARELEKTRGVERQELRYKCYAALWSKLRQLAIYDDTAIDKRAVDCLSRELSNWYFSETGGLLLTPQARDFYFALQDLLRTTARLEDNWQAERRSASEGEHKRTLHELLTQRNATQARNALEYLSAGDFGDWQAQAPALAKKWREGIVRIAADWMTLNEAERFAVLQQAGSKLRTSLTIDLESRAR